MRIGILPSSTRLDGGMFQYGLTLMKALSQINRVDDFVVFHRWETDLPLSQLRAGHWETVPLSLKDPSPNRNRVPEILRAGKGMAQKALRGLGRRLYSSPLKPKKYLAGDFDTIQHRGDWKEWFIKKGIELMIYLNASTLSFETGLPYVMAVYDLQHRLQPEFPEVSAEGEWEWREYFFRNGTRQATLILVDSEVGKEDVLEFYGPYGVTPDRVWILPYLPACNLDRVGTEEENLRLRREYRLPDRYLFYPAQFWPHKNHLRIVEALGILRKHHHLEIHLVLVGSHTGKIRERTFREIISRSSQLEVDPQVHYLGYVPEPHMPALYAGATALVMPTFFGPTNIPVLEAWSAGCPVLTSAIRGIREQVGDGGLLVDPRSEEAMAEAIAQLWKDPALCRDLAERGRRRLMAYTPEDFQRRLGAILEEVKKNLRQQRKPEHAAIG